VGRTGYSHRFEVLVLALGVVALPGSGLKGTHRDIRIDLVSKGARSVPSRNCVEIFWVVAKISEVRQWTKVRCEVALAGSLRRVSVS